MTTWEWIFGILAVAAVTGSILLCHRLTHWKLIALERDAQLYLLQQNDISTTHHEGATQHDRRHHEGRFESLNPQAS